MHEPAFEATLPKDTAISAVHERCTKYEWVARSS